MAGPLPVGLVSAGGGAAVRWPSFAGAAAPRTKAAKKRMNAAAATAAANAQAADRQNLRLQLRELLRGEGGHFATDVHTRQSALECAVELLRTGDPDGLVDIVRACACQGTGGLQGLGEVLEALDVSVKGMGAVNYECYCKVVDAIGLAPTADFALPALALLLRWRFTPSLTNFGSQDSREYFVRQVYFISVEFAVQVAESLRQATGGGGPRGGFGGQSHGAPCDLTPMDDSSNWELRPLSSAWPPRAENFSAEDAALARQGRKSGTSAPVRGDVVLLAVRGEVVVAVAQGVAGGIGLASCITLAVEQNERLRRLLGAGSGRPTVQALVGPSKVQNDRMRTAIYELSRRSTSVPAMQRWLLKPPVCETKHGPAGMPDVPKDGKARLWARRYEPPASLASKPQLGERLPVEALGAEWNEDLQPGLREGTLLFDESNAYGVEAFRDSVAAGKVVVTLRGECPLAEKVRNAAAGGAVGAVVVDTCDGELFPMKRDDMPFEVEFPAGYTPGLHVEVCDDGRLMVVEIAADSVAAARVSEGDCVEDLTGDGARSLVEKRGFVQMEEFAAFLSTEEPLLGSIRVAFRKAMPVPTIPAVLIPRQAGECLIEAARAASSWLPVVAELHVAERAERENATDARAGEMKDALNGPQMEAVRRAFDFKASAKGGNVSLIQGPPGTGKTTVALQIISTWLTMDAGWESRVENGRPCQYNKWTEEVLYGDTLLAPSNKILVTGFSNIAIDNIALGLQRHNLGPILRVGRGQSVLTTDTLEERIRSHPAFGELERLRAGSSTRGEAMKLERRIQAELVSQAKVILATCIASGADVLQYSRFRRVLFDEATQATEPASLVPLMRGCEQLVLIGDQKQLPPLVYSHEGRELGLHESLFERLVRLRLPRALLTIQYRMHPAISAFPSAAFYENLLTDGVSAAQRPAPRGFAWPNAEQPLCFEGVGAMQDVLEEQVGTSRRNAAEAKRVVEIVKGLLAARDVRPEGIAVISPYAAQTALLRTALARCAPGLPYEHGIQVATVDSFQGVEKDVVICSTVRGAALSGGGVGFLSDRRRFNVLLTRARRGLIVVGHQATLLRDPCWRDWVQHVTSRNLVNGQVMASYEIQASVMASAENLDTVGVDGAGPGRWMAFAGEMWRPFGATAAATSAGAAAAPLQPAARGSAAGPHPKSRLLESGLFGAACPLAPMIEELGASHHSRTFRALLQLPGGAGVAAGEGRNKKDAERACCEQAVAMLGPELLSAKRRRC
eukprot:TRINITY_DN4482_c0_g1_i1.p1 TRINITY_DN4482_c0_g1~~TRINITY_DN4482_c0_g1_i1.p1  ORF type:complete len:1251 (-),score=302.29 TRINITY_DN4482_c0_g1_i1:146-3898(-)